MGEIRTVELDEKDWLDSTLTLSNSYSTYYRFFLASTFTFFLISLTSLSIAINIALSAEIHVEALYILGYASLIGGFIFAILATFLLIKNRNMTQLYFDILCNKIKGRSEKEKVNKIYERYLSIVKPKKNIHNFRESKDILQKIKNYKNYKRILKKSLGTIFVVLAIILFIFAVLKHSEEYPEFGSYQVSDREYFKIYIDGEQIGKLSMYGHLISENGIFAAGLPIQFNGFANFSLNENVNYDQEITFQFWYQHIDLPLWAKKPDHTLPSFSIKPNEVKQINEIFEFPAEGVYKHILLNRSIIGEAIEGENLTYAYFNGREVSLQIKNSKILWETNKNLLVFTLVIGVFSSVLVAELFFRKD